MANYESHNRNKEQYEKAGEQAAQVLGRFISIASEFTSEFSRQSDTGNKPRSDTEYKKTSEDAADIIRETGEQLKKMREAAGYTLDSFSEALKNEINRDDIDRSDVVTKVEAAESGQRPLPQDWFNQVATLLGSTDIPRFFERLQEGYEASGDAARTSWNRSESGHPETIQEARVKKFTALFDADEELAHCSDEQFEKLLGFVENSFKEAKNLVISK